MTPPPSAAEQLLQSLAVELPCEIDLRAVAWSVGIVDIVKRPLDGCEARIVGCAGRAVISVKEGVRSTRQRFSICHELGHWHHHRGQLLYCKTADMHQREVAEAKEAVANRFASDLLLPPYLVRPYLSGRATVDMKLVNLVANEFQASFTATAIKLAKMVDSPSMVVCHGKSGRKWHVPHSRIPRNWFPRKNLDERSPAFQMLFSTGQDQATPRKVKASTWFERWDAERYDILEQSFQPQDGEVVTILTFADARMIDESR